MKTSVLHIYSSQKINEIIIKNWQILNSNQPPPFLILKNACKQGDVNLNFKQTECKLRLCIDALKFEEKIPTSMTMH